jgi:hypothetical protein
MSKLGLKAAELWTLSEGRALSEGVAAQAVEPGTVR